MRTLAFSLPAFLSVVSFAPAATIVVDLSGGGDFTDIRAGVAAARSGDTVLVKPGEYLVDESIDIGWAIAVVSEAGPGATTIRMSETPANPARAGVVVFTGGAGGPVSFSGFRLTGGKPSAGGWNGGGVTCKAMAKPEISDCIIEGNSAGGGGGVFCMTGAAPKLTGCTISGNSAGYGGGVYCDASFPQFTGCTISGNSARSFGGGVYLSGKSNLGLTGCTISGNSASQGGAVYGGSGGWLSFCTVSGNTTTEEAGAVGGYGSILIDNSILWGNAGGPVGDRIEIEAWYSCIEADAPLPGKGNINLDPLFCGWEGAPEVWVDPDLTGSGEGTRENPYSDPAAATRGYSLALSSASPCLGAGLNGADMGAVQGASVCASSRRRLVHLAAGNYRAEDLDLVHEVSLEGSGEGATVLEGDVLGLRTGSTVSSLTVTKGETAGGILVAPGDSPAIESVTITGIPKEARGAVVCSGSSPTLTRCTISENAALGVSVGGGAPSFIDCTISGNQGGGVGAGGGSPTFSGCTISGNGGSGMAFWGSPGSAVVEGCTIQGNVAECGGGVSSILNASLRLSRCVISENAALSCGGGLGVQSGSSIELADCTISRNWAADGGGLALSDDTVSVLTRCAVAGNAADQRGGGLYCAGGPPGGISFNATLQSSTIEGNWAPLGGGIYTLSAQMQMTNCILSGNSAVEGGGLVSTFDDGLRLLNCTIAGNSATDDAQISCQLGSVPQVKNSIVWEEPSGAVCGEVLHTISREDPLFVKEGVFNRHRFVKVTIGGVAYDLPDFIVDPPDYHLRAGSPAIGAGTPEGAPPEDIEGTGRPCAGGFDAGAYQSGGCESGVFRRGDTDGNGKLDVTDPIRVLQFLFRGGVTLSCLDAADVDDTGSLNLTDPIYLLSFLFHGSQPPPSPHPECGQDESPEGLGCDSYEGCD